MILKAHLVSLNWRCLNNAGVPAGWDRITKYSFFNLIAFCAVFFISQAVFAQSQDSSPSEAKPSDSQIVSQVYDETQIPFSLDSDSQPEQVSTPAPNTFFVFVRMVLMLAIVVAAIYFIFKLMKKSIEPGKEDDPFLRKVSSITLSPGKTVQIVTLVDKAYMLGVSDNTVSLIDKIDDAELINAMNLNADKNSSTKHPKTFSEILEIFMPSKKFEKSENTESAYSSDTDNLIDSLGNKTIGGEASE